MPPTTETTMTVSIEGPIQLLCPCGKHVIVGMVPELQRTIVLHALPYCEAFERERPPGEYLREVERFQEHLCEEPT